jgi:hypothetical protein
LIERQLEAGEEFVAVYVVVYIAMDEARSDFIPVLFQEELSSHDESAAAVIGKETGHPNRGRGRNLVVLAKGEDIANHRDNSRTDRGA